MKTKFAQTSWCIEDIQSERPDWSDEQCRDFLIKHEVHLLEGMVSHGWCIINQFLEEYENRPESK